MKTKLLIAHARGEENLAERLAEPLRAAGYEVAHEGTVMVGASIVGAASKLLGEGAPVILCGTVRAVGTKWGRLVINAARRHAGVRIFIVQMEEEADVEMVSFDEAIARYWQDPAKATGDLIAALEKYYPSADSGTDPITDARHRLQQQDLEARYRQLTLAACDIIDLANLPEDDRHLATRELELRRLYVALRLRLEIAIGDEPDDERLKQLEARRAESWGEAGRRNDDEEDRVSLGERLQKAKRLVVLGDPGAGKSTLLRWLATAYLLRLKNDPEFTALPDVASLPEDNWLPILVRCRDLPPEADTLDLMLFHTLRKSELAEPDCAQLEGLLRERLQVGTAILLVDGLDEIMEPAARIRFSQQLEQIHRAFPAAPMVVTSRIVGYREMGYRIRSGFEHLTVADLSKDDKDEFARRWCNLTVRSGDPAAAAEELIRDIHSTDRIERLTGNSMLLTTMALIKRKIGRLPQRRVDLYEKAVEVLLNWRSEVDTPLDAREGLPQLEYLAHAMCADGVQRLREDEILALLGEMRAAYPNIHALTQHTPEEFLRLLEARAGLLIQSGHAKHNGRSAPVYEFRHLTFQEYLAGIALVQGHYRGWDRGRTLAEAIAPLAGQVGEIGEYEWNKETAVVENWREGLRLCVAACNDSEVEGALAAILEPLPGETGTARPRAVLAGLCLADEPNVGEELAEEVLRKLVAQVEEWDGDGSVSTSLNAAAMEIARSRWKEILGDCLLDEFLQPAAATCKNPGGLYAMVRKIQVPTREREFYHWLAEQVVQLSGCGEREAAGIALTVMIWAFYGRDCRVPGLVDGLIQLLSSNAALSHGVAWALLGMNMGNHREYRWHPTPAQRQQLIAAAARPDCDSQALGCLSRIFRNERAAGAVDALLARLAGGHPSNTREIIAEALGAIGDTKAAEPLVARLQNAEEDTNVREAAAEALGRIGDPKAVDALVARLEDAGEYTEVRQAAAEALGQIGDPKAVDALVTRLRDAGEDTGVRRVAATALGKIGTEPTLNALQAALRDTVEAVRRAALGSLAQTCKDETDRRLLFDNLYGFGPWLDPARPIDTARIEKAAQRLGETPEAIRRRYQALAARFGLTLAAGNR
uniref:NACHT domain-containing protein n=1 Tax=Candidatus Kentrum sp. FM TaxID=2126340 RepID=A0A450VZX3_9GAMM|nr:MAG: NACHT domain-containing protein [Candidatus Kentron sp. FM]VFJ50815.1 MAG: NACHT domain-containing protein [Candidatus Kentron sp. FM]VFK10354.1 MAG: NACHT domain-containing protein [Candidatus Kentron sp. FM]